jgi:hypothetical protein
MKFQNVLAVLVLLLCFTYFFFVGHVIKGSSPEQSAILNMITGAAITMVVGVVQFFFGSSKSSADKSDTINQMIGNAQVVATQQPTPALPGTPPVEQSKP